MGLIFKLLLKNSIYKNNFLLLFYSSVQSANLLAPTAGLFEDFNSSTI
jgi:hypothetical protein